MEGTEKRREGRWNKGEKRNKLGGERRDEKRVQDRGVEASGKEKSQHMWLFYFSPKASLLFAICVAYSVLHRNNEMDQLPKLKNTIT